MQVISYTRFSSPRQARGDSVRRQTALAEDWCVRHDHTLDMSLRLTDEGKSGWSGANMRTGALAALLQLANDKRIQPGTILLIEALDRLTRTDLTVAVPLLLQLLGAGLTIVTLQDGKEWTRQGMKDMTDFVMSVMLLARGHEESQRKSQLVRAAFDAHRQRSSNQIFGSAPGWLTRQDKHSPWLVDESKAQTVRDVFDLSAGGWGSVQIAKYANAQGWPVPTRLGNKDQGWHVRMAGILLKNRAVLGEHEFRLRGNEHNEKHWHGQSTGIVLPDFYPRIVTDDLWHRAQAAIATRLTSPKRRDEQYYNIWAGMIRCGRCGATMYRRTERKGKYMSGLFKCSAAAAGKTDCPSTSIKLTDYVLLSEVCRLAASRMGTGQQTDDWGTKLAITQSRLSALDAATVRVATAIADTGDALPALRDKARELADSRRALLAEIQSINGKIATTAHSLFDTDYADRIMPVLYTPGDEAMAIRADCNTRLRRAVANIWLWPYEVALVKYQGEETCHMISLPAKKNQGDPESEDTVARPHLILAMAGHLTPGQAVEKMWLWPYEVALVKYQGVEGRQTIPLRPRRRRDPQPHLDLALAGKLKPTNSHRI
jgi:DNA invertase Pin-like site-specific DNA recombinase